MPNRNPLAQPEVAARRPWCGLLAISAPILGACSCIGILASQFNPIRGNPFETQVSPGVLLWCAICLVGIVAGGASLIRRERWRALSTLALTGNSFLLLFLALWWIFNAPQGPVRQREMDEEKERWRLEAIERERDSKNLRLRLSYENPPDWLRLTHSAWKSDIDQFQRPGTDGPLTGPVFPKGVTARVVWPEPRQFEVSILVDVDEVSLKFQTMNLHDVTATRDGEALAVPFDVPPGKQRIVVKGRVP